MIRRGDSEALLIIVVSNRALKLILIQTKPSADQPQSALICISFEHFHEQQPEPDRNGKIGVI